MGSIISGGSEAEITTLIDEVDGNTTYLGKAKLGSSEGAAVWQIKKLGRTGTVLKIQYVNGSRRYNQIWDNRTSLTYSD